LPPDGGGPELFAVDIGANGKRFPFHLTKG
jgi:hypothetical protein